MCFEKVEVNGYNVAVPIMKNILPLKSGVQLACAKETVSPDDRKRGASAPRMLAKRGRGRGK